jgi:3-oxoacyl-[acyl-carrier-protein] synthase II
MDIAITGRGVVSSIGQSAAAFHSSLAANRTKISPPPFAPRPEFDGVWVSNIEDFYASDWMPEQVAAGTDRFQQYALAAAVQAVRDAGFDDAPPDTLRTATVIGSALGGVETIAGSQAGLSERGPEGIARKFHIQAWSNMAAAQIALRWQLHGPLLTIATACASSLDAIGIAARMIASGQADYAIAGGADASMTELRVLSGGRYGMFKGERDPAKACRPFDRHRTGVVLGEGAGVIFLERLDFARARNAEIHGIVRGYASLSDGHHVSSPGPHGTWQATTIEMALAEAQVTPQRIDAVMAHGTGTPAGDLSEIRAINLAFGQAAPSLRVTSLKGHIGHSAGGAAALSLIAGLECMKAGALVPTAGTTVVDPEARFRVPTGRPAPGAINAMLVNAFGFGGQNAAVVVAVG